MKEITAEVFTKAESSHYINALQALLADESKAMPGVNTLARFQSLSIATQKQDLELIIANLREFIGEGSGLTPSGDDLLCGFLLAMNRWNPRDFPGDLLIRLNNAIIQTANEKTTALAANLIEIAAEGEADERLITVLDSIFTGEPSPEKAAELLISYGSSSGTDAFCGMAIVIK